MYLRVHVVTVQGMPSHVEGITSGTHKEMIILYLAELKDMNGYMAFITGAIRSRTMTRTEAVSA